MAAATTSNAAQRGNAVAAARGVLPARDAPARAAVDVDTAIRSVLFVLMFLSVWISFHPYQSLADPPQAVTEGGDRVNQIGFTVLFVALGTWTYFHEPQRLLLLVRPLMIATLLWCAAGIVFSWEPALAFRRFVFTLVVMGMAGMVMLLPKNVRHFADLMAAVVLIVLAACYVGLVVAPQLTIHQATDFLEPEHAGEWRGAFTHKNMAGMTMVLFVFVGMFVARVRSFGLGASIVALSAIFLVFSGSKTAMAILPLALILTAFITRTRQHALTIALVIGILIAFEIFTVGSIYFEPVQHLLDTLLPDPSFTGRTQLWEFAVQHVMQRPIMGYGFYSFWGTEEVVYGLGQNQAWVNSASDAHNTYLNLALSIGLPGLVLSVLWIVVMPVVDFFHRPAGTPVSPMHTLFLRVLLFGVYSSCFENSFFQQLDSVWFLFVSSVFGLRYLSVARAVM